MSEGERPVFTPRETVGELDRYIVGQDKAKRAVAIALRNRWRRQRVPEALRAEITPKNILMVGPTGVGKTEIARRLAKMIRAPFVKVEASKYTEVGYVGRDVESMIRDLAEEAVNLEKEEAKKTVERKAEAATEDRILDLLLPPSPPGHSFEDRADRTDRTDRSTGEDSKTRETFRRMLREGRLDDRTVEIETIARAPMSTIQNFSPEGVQDMVVQIQDMMGIRGGPKKRRKLTVKEAREVILEEETNRLIDHDRVQRDALVRASETGIVFIDEIDKVVGSGGARTGGPDVSREGVQRDLLPVVEGCTVTTKYGRVTTDHVLFIAAGAFHKVKVSDLIPELQGRFPIRVELDPLREEDFVRILKEPRNSLITQYTALLETEGVSLEFTDEAIEDMARIAAQANSTLENIGARRLHTVMEALLEDLSFSAPELKDKKVRVDRAMVRERLGKVLESEDLSRFVL
ncbi:MAG: ATP-dependent protease ATPase subunit HslU [Deltaproteobacteria bacterium]|nr:ATP-dependent protease ATPase subunit HslU [Deltaproteobacteria bacterium]